MKRQTNKHDLKKNQHSGKRKKTIGRFLKFWSKDRETTTEIGALDEENYEYNFGDHAKTFYDSNDKLKAAKTVYDMSIPQLKDLEFYVHTQNVNANDAKDVNNDAEDKDFDNNDTENENVKNYDANINNLRKAVDNHDGVAKAITEAKITYDKKPNNLPKTTEMLDPDFQNAILDPAFQNAHKDKFVHFNDAKRLYERSLKDYEVAKDRFDKATNNYNQRRVEFENSVKEIAHAKNTYLTSADELKKAYDVFAKPKKRNLYDVYFRALSEAKKNTVATEKSSFRMITDKTLAK